MEEAKNLDLFLDLNYLTESSLFKIKDVNESTNKLLEEYKEIAINQVIQNFESSPDSCVKCYTMFLPFLLIKIDVFS
ncbi:hypothetical protein ACEWB3_09765 [Staphylococcus haemolyticus]|uniref:hypothetical protein n=1 Tax=Staphylococcus haemolyticus TaxID=1283 RepID=UPI003989CC2A